jgi:hypothetical protein
LKRIKEALKPYAVAAVASPANDDNIRVLHELSLHASPAVIVACFEAFVLVEDTENPTGLGDGVVFSLRVLK